MNRVELLAALHLAEQNLRGLGVRGNAAEIEEAYIVVAKLTAERDDLARRVEGLEQLRPVWAQGWSGDSVAAQVSAAALSQIWHALGVTNQTDAMAAIARLQVESI
jgi:hypothetical protein